MIKEVKMYTVICDNCGVDVCEGQEISAWGEEFWVKEIAENSDWHVGQFYHYCPDCFTYDDDDNVLVILRTVNQPKTA